LYKILTNGVTTSGFSWEAPGIKLIASGGISTFDELPKLAELGCEGTISKAIYEGRISFN
jgi:phosphoribosylformimino-5-aminoimidazole carboxamide ribonucleotide (ProFAR) isomerase